MDVGRGWGLRRLGHGLAVVASLIVGRGGTNATAGFLGGLGAASRGVILQTSMLLAARSVLPLLLPQSARDDDSRAFFSWQNAALSSLQLTFALAALASAAFDSLPQPFASIAASWLGPRGPTSGILLAYETLVLVAGPLVACAEAAALTVDVVAVGSKMLSKMRYHPQTQEMYAEEKTVWKAAIVIFSVLSLALSIAVGILLRDASSSGGCDAWVILPIVAFVVFFFLLAIARDSNLFEVSVLTGYCSILALLARVEAGSLQSPLPLKTVLGAQLLRAQGLTFFFSAPLAVYTIRRAPTIIGAAIDETIDFPELSVIQAFLTTVALTFRLLVYHGMQLGEYWPASWRIAQGITAVVTYLLCLLDSEDSAQAHDKQR